LENNDILIKQTDIVYKDDFVTAFIASYFIGNNSGHVIIVPNEHIENIFDMTQDVSSHIAQVSKTIAFAVKEAYNAGGITTLQNNGPDAGQHAFHYHLHIFPRHKDDKMYDHMMKKRETTPEERLPYAEKIKQYFSRIDPEYH
jgi:histidine triad (HIT) family protein